MFGRGDTKTRRNVGNISEAADEDDSLGLDICHITINKTYIKKDN